MSKATNPPQSSRPVRRPDGASGVGTTNPKWIWLIGALAVATASLGFRVVAGMFLVSPQSDQYIAGYAFREFAAQSLRDGHGFPQWNPFMFGGMPYVAAMHGDIFYPTFLLRLIMPTDLAMTWGFIMHLFLAGVFTVGFLRALGLSRWAAAFGGLSYMMSGPIASYASAGHDGKLFVSALLPLALWMLVRAIHDGQLYAWGAFALTVGLAVLSPHPQLLQYLLLTCGAFAVFLVWGRSTTRNATATDHGIGGLLTNNATANRDLAKVRSGRNRFANLRFANIRFANTRFANLRFANIRFANVRFAVTRLSAALAMVLLGLGIGAIQYWPVLAYVNSSPRANGRAYEFATSFSLPPEELFNMYLPQFSGMLGQYWGRNGIHLHSEYLGIVVLMLVPLAFGRVAGADAVARKQLARFWSGVAMVALLWALGGFTPFFHVIYALVPGTRFFRAPSTIIYVLTFALCVLSALGFERVLARRLHPRLIKRYIIGWMSFASVIAVLGQSGVLTRVAKQLSYGVAKLHGHDPKGFAEFVGANQSALAPGALRSLAFVLIVAALMSAWYARKLSATRFAALLVLTGGADLWSIAHSYWRFSQPAATLFASDPILRYLQVQTQPGRVVVYTRSTDHRVSSDPYYGGRGFGEGAGFMVHGIRSVTGYHGNQIARYDELSANGASVNPSFWQHENVRWMYTNLDIADSILHKINGPTFNSAGSASYLYEIPGDNSYSWVASSFGTRDDVAAAKEVLRNDYNPRAFVSVAPATEINGQAVHVAPALLTEPSTIKTTVSDFGPGRATIQLDAPAIEGSALVIAENYYKGWRAMAGGKPLPVMRAAYNLVGVPLPVGARTVAFTFQDERYYTGRLVTLIALGVTAMLTALGWRRRQTH